MQTQLISSRFTSIARWLVPIAAALAIAAWFYIAPEGALGKLDAIGYAVCHRIDARSFHIGNRQLPLCARCTGEFFSAAIGLIFMGFVSGKRSKLPARGIMAVLILFFLAFAIDGSNSFLYLLKQTAKGSFDNIPNLYIPNNTLRLFTGSGMGIALASILYPAFNQSVWKDSIKERALDWKKLGILVGTIVVVDLAILTENPIVLYPIAFLSVLGVLGLLIIVFSMMWLLLMHQENEFTSLRSEEHTSELQSRP